MKYDKSYMSESNKLHVCIRYMYKKTIHQNIIRIVN